MISESVPSEMHLRSNKETQLPPEPEKETSSIKPSADVDSQPKTNDLKMEVASSKKKPRSAMGLNTPPAMFSPTRSPPLKFMMNFDTK